MELRDYKLDDLLDFYNGKSIKAADQGEYPVYGSNGQIGWTDEWKYKNAIILGRVGTYCGYVEYCKDKFWASDNTIVVKPKSGDFDVDFLYYFLKNAKLNNYAGGAAQPLITQTVLKQVPARVPVPVEAQRSTASFLRAYDDLIENNTQRIKILEKMARVIYREWFVKFRFPGHEKVKMTDSPLGPIPEGWEVKTVEETFEINGGGTPSKKVDEYWEDGTINWYVPRELTAASTMFMDESTTKITDLGLRKSSARRFPAFSVMMTSRATLGVTAINTTEACTNQGFITCIPNERFPLYTLYYWLRENVEGFCSLASGATFKEITKGVFKTIRLALPLPDLLAGFEEMVKPIGAQIINLQRRNRILYQTRNLLLPRLISGQIEVSELVARAAEAT